MSTTKILTIVCWVISVLVLVGLAIWFLTSSTFGGWFNGSGININLGTGFNIQSLTGPFDNRYSEAVNEADLHSIRIDWVAGEVTVIPHDGSDIQITESAQRALDNNEQMRISTDGGTLRIRFREQSIGLINMPRKNLEVLVPRGLSEDLNNLSVSTTSGSIHVQDFNATTFDASSVSATIDVSGIVSNHIDLGTTSGAITATSVRAGKLNASSVSGAVNLSEAYVTAIDVSTTSGRTIAEGEFERVDVSTISGNTTIRSAIAPETMYISSVSGAIDIYLPNNGEITVNHSAVSGRFSSAVPVILQNRAAYSFSSVSGNTNIHVLGE
ncbi:MAG: DUF4097 domain-containing protein [Oscillospiraceae bacterium]|nr:DUF4097 domain-containing protein [Oscillospiraceae bacterium]